MHLFTTSVLKEGRDALIMRVAAIRNYMLVLVLKEFLASSSDATFGFVDFMAEVGAGVLVLVFKRLNRY